jgi:organic hydroperoxide reductase OsmC/OhrA
MLSITLNPVVQFEGEAPREEIIIDLHERAHESCFIASSVKTRVLISPVI